MIEPSEEVKKVEQRYEKALDDMEKHYKDALKQIKAEISDLADSDAYGDYQQGFNFGLMRAAQIIDKYMKGEQE